MSDTVVDIESIRISKLTIGKKVKLAVTINSAYDHSFHIFNVSPTGIAHFESIEAVANAIVALTHVEYTEANKNESLDAYVTYAAEHIFKDTLNRPDVYDDLVHKVMNDIIERVLNEDFTVTYRWEAPRR